MPPTNDYRKTRDYARSGYNTAVAAIILSIIAIGLAIGLSVGLYRLAFPANRVLDVDQIENTQGTTILINDSIIMASGTNITTGVFSATTASVSGFVNAGGFIKHTTAAQSTSNTLTAALLLDPGLVVLDTSGGAVTLTLPTPVLLAAELSGIAVGDVVQFKVVNQGHATNAVVLAAAGTGMTYAGDYATRFVAAGSARTVDVRFTAVTSGAETYTVI